MTLFTWYSCVVWTEGVLTPDAIASIDAIHNLTIEQQTPVRVLHRRTQMTRPKIIHSAKCEVLNKHYMLLRLVTSAGTYVKEFVHGDRGRTLQMLHRFWYASGIWLSVLLLR